MSRSFIEKAMKIHGDRYDYLLVEYKNVKTKVKIICKIHGIFEQTPNNHIYVKSGCPKCYGNDRFTKNSQNLELSLEKSDLFKLVVL